MCMCIIKCSATNQDWIFANLTFPGQINPKGIWSYGSKMNRFHFSVPLIYSDLLLSEFTV